MSETREQRPSPSHGQASAAQRPQPIEPAAPTIGDWLHIEPDGTVIVFTGKAEVGQNIRTSLAQAVAEELCMPVDTIHLVMADTDRTPFDMGTFGSRTTPIMASRLHQVAAATRELLIDLVAERWHVDRGELRAVAGAIHHDRTGRAIGLGELTQGQRLTQEYDGAQVTPAVNWSIAGTGVRNVDGRAIVTGQRLFTPDLTRPEMLVGKVLRPPALGGQLIGLDTSAAGALPVVVVHEGDFVGVAAAHRLMTTQALGQIRAEWEVPPQIAAAELYSYLKEHPAPPVPDQRWGGPERYECGSLDEGRATADHVLAQSYTVAYIAHAPLEPRAALAEWNGDRLTVWTGTQRPFGVRGELAQAFGLPESDVRVIVPDTGSAYGGKHTGEVAIEAARLARAAGRPVKLIWTREEEFSWAYLRPAGVIDIASAVRADGVITAWVTRCVRSRFSSSVPP
jgi:isoquinoline 1-oxidoreductase